MLGILRENEYVISAEAFEVKLGPNIGKWNARFVITKKGETRCRGAIGALANSKDEAEREAISEACRMLSPIPKIIY